MNTWIALLRGINVGGKNILPMAGLRQLLTDLGFASAKTYIQSGNCIFQSECADARQIQSDLFNGIQRTFGLAIPTQVISLSDFKIVASQNPFAKNATDPKTVHFHFLTGPAISPDWKMIDSLKSSTEQLALEGKTLFLYAPDGIGRSKLAGRIDQCLGVSGTGRNLRTVLNILELAKTI